jgi:hypothetical protein
MDTNVTVKWLGISGVEVGMGEERILIDPVFSRVPFGRTLFGKAVPDEEAVRRHAPRSRGIFVTHAHHDHLMDAPLISTLTGAGLYGSASTCHIAGVCGAEPDKLHTLTCGSAVQAGPIRVTVFPSEHIRLPGFGYGKPRRSMEPPLRARYYRMDESFVFLVEAGGFRLLVGPGICLGDPGELDALLCCPIYLGKRLAGYVGGLRPRVFLPIHWEDMFRRDDGHPMPGRLPGIPPRRLDMEAVARQTGALGIRYLLPEIRREYPLAGLLGKK